MRHATKTNGAKAYTEMTMAELREATKGYDAATSGDKLPGRALTGPQRVRFERARKRGRPKIGRGAKVISMSVEQNLLMLADSRAKREGISRAELFARGLRMLLAKAG